MKMSGGALWSPVTLRDRRGAHPKVSVYERDPAIAEEVQRDLDAEAAVAIAHF
jgi:hypothetical protein